MNVRHVSQYLHDIIILLVIQKPEHLPPVLPRQLSQLEQGLYVFLAVCEVLEVVFSYVR